MISAQIAVCELPERSMNCLSDGFGDPVVPLLEQIEDVEFRVNALESPPAPNPRPPSYRP
jgi:hypothetical protein